MGEPLEAVRDLGSGQGQHRGGRPYDGWRQMHARGAGRRDEQQRMARGGCRGRTGGRSFELGEEVESG